MIKRQTSYWDTQQDEEKGPGYVSPTTRTCGASLLHVRKLCKQYLTSMSSLGIIAYICVITLNCFLYVNIQVYRFPDLLKRWDDVDGSRGTWYARLLALAVF
jgi:hypothetical protein